MIIGLNLQALEREMAGLDYNNQRNLLWRLMEIARANETDTRYDWNIFPYSRDMFSENTPLKGSKELEMMASRLTQIGGGCFINEIGFKIGSIRRITLKELMEVQEAA